MCCYGGTNFKPFVDDVIYSCFPVIIVLFVLNYYTYRMQDGCVTRVPTGSCLLRPMVIGVGSEQPVLFILIRSPLGVTCTLQTSVLRTNGLGL